MHCEETAEILWVPHDLTNLGNLCLRHEFVEIKYETESTYFYMLCLYTSAS